MKHRHILYFLLAYGYVFLFFSLLVAKRLVNYLSFSLVQFLTPYRKRWVKIGIRCSCLSLPKKVHNHFIFQSGSQLFFVLANLKCSHDNTILHSEISRGDKARCCKKAGGEPIFRADLASKLDILSSNLTASIDQQNKHLKAPKIFTGIQNLLSDHLSELAHFAMELGEVSYLI